jgi:dethiobiotin synthetase
VPLASETTYADLAVACDLPLLIVGANRLGTINHCALTARVAVAMGLIVRGFLLSSPTATTDASAAGNAQAITALTKLLCLGSLAHAPSFEAASEALDVDAIVPA